MSNSNNGSLRNRVARNALRRSNSFTRLQIASVTGVSLRHTTRVLSELVSSGALVRVTTGIYTVA